MEKLADYTKIALIAFVGIWIINRGLKAMNLSRYEA